jgi:hypothetical protein
MAGITPHLILSGAKSKDAAKQTDDFATGFLDFARE